MASTRYTFKTIRQLGIAAFLTASILLCHNINFGFANEPDPELIKPELTQEEQHEEFPPLENLINPNPSARAAESNKQNPKKTLPLYQSGEPSQPTPTQDLSKQHSPSTTLTQHPSGPPAKMETVYTELPGILVLPIIPPMANKAFHDSSVMVANSLAEGLSQKLKETTVHQPYYTLQNLHHQGFDKLYKQLNDEYYQSGSPSPTLTQYLLDKLQPTSATPPIHRIIFVQSNVNMNQPDKSYHIMDIFNRLVNDEPSNTPRYLLDTRVKVYDSTSPHLTMLWQGRWTEPVKTQRFANISVSIFDTSDARAAFQKASNRISKVLMLRAPKNSYMQPNTQPVTTATRLNGRRVNRMFKFGQ